MLNEHNNFTPELLNQDKVLESFNPFDPFFVPHKHHMKEIPQVTSIIVKARTIAILSDLPAEKLFSF